MASFRIWNTLPSPAPPKPLRVALAEAPFLPEDDPPGPVAGMPSGGEAGSALGPVAGTPLPASPPQGGFGFPGVFPTMGPGNTVFGFGGFGGWGWGWPYPLQVPYRRNDLVCAWQEVPPKEDTPLICVRRAPEPPVAWASPGWGW